MLNSLDFKRFNVKTTHLSESRRKKMLEREILGLIAEL